MADTLGSALAAARRARGKSLTEAEAATRIRAKMLEALERDEYDTLPSPAYVRGYIISYAKFLELDPQPLLKQYSDETGHRTNREQMRLPEQVVPTRERQHAVPWGTALAIAGIVALIAIAVWGIGRLARGPEQLPPVPNVPETTSSAGSETTTETAPATITTETTPVQTTEPSAQAFKLRVEIAADGASWLRVTVDGLKAYEGTLAGGQTKEWEVTNEAVVRVGKPSAVSIFRNQDKLEIPSAAQTPQMTITATDPQPAGATQ